MKFNRLFFICLLLAILTMGAVSADDNITEPVAMADDNPVAIADENSVGAGNSAPEIEFAMPERNYVAGEAVYFATDINNGIVDVSVDGNPTEYGYLDDVDEVSYGYYINSTDLAVGNHTLGVKITNDSYYRDSFFSATFSIKEIIVQVKEDADLKFTPRVSVHLPYDATGNLKVTCNGEDIKDIENYGCLREAYLENYLNVSVRDNINPVVVTYTGDEKYGSFNKTYNVVPRYEISASDRYETIGRFSDWFYFYMPDKVAIEKLHALVDGEEYEVKWDGFHSYHFDMSNLAGKHNVTISFDGDDRFYPSNVTRTINLVPEIKWYCSPTAGSDAKVVIPTYGPNDTVFVQLSSSKDNYSFRAVAVDGVATVLLSKVNYGSYDAWIYVYYGDSYDFRRFTMTIANSKLTAGDMTKYYGSSTAFKVKVTTSGGKIVKNKYVKFYINGKYVKKVKTTKNGYATLKITKAPGSYKISAKYGKVIITRNLNVKHVVTLKTVAVKKSAKSLTLKATLKQGKKALKYKKVTFKFNGKTYKVKTNKYGVAKVTIKKAVLKKLKVGKTVTYQATYLKDTVKKSVKVKK